MDKKEIARIQKQEQHRALTMQRQAIERELNGPGYSQDFQERPEIKRIKAAVAEAKETAFKVYEYNTYSSAVFEGYQQQQERNKASAS